MRGAPAHHGGAIVKDAGKVITVTGPMEPAQLGVTLTHEHLFIDLTKFYELHPDPEVAAELEGPLSIEMLGYMKRCHRWNRDNLVLDDPETALAEVRRFQRLGGATICDVSSRGIRVDGHAEKLRHLSQALGLNIVMGTSYYRSRTHDEVVARAGIDELAELFAQEVDEGIGPDKVRAGIIGEVGLEVPVHPDEEKVLRAAARAHLRTGAPIVIHQTDPESKVPGRALDVLEAAGVNPNRVVIGHVDVSSLDALKAAMRRGAYVAYDCIGFEGCFLDYEYPSDVEYARRIAHLVEAGFVDRLLLSHDRALKHHLRRYGGYGYDYILRDFRQVLLRTGVSDEAFRVMMVDNPARLLPIGL